MELSNEAKQILNRQLEAIRREKERINKTQEEIDKSRQSILEQEFQINSLLGNLPESAISVGRSSRRCDRIFSMLKQSPTPMRLVDITRALNKVGDECSLASVNAQIKSAGHIYERVGRGKYQIRQEARMFEHPPTRSQLSSYTEGDK